MRRRRGEWIALRVGGRDPSRRRRVDRRLQAEALEGRQLLAVFTVDSIGDADVSGTLRWAINQSNANAGEDTINFAIVGAGTHTITPATPLPTVTDRVTIDGASQGVSATPLIIIDGIGAGAGANGLTFSGAGGTTATSSRVTALNIQKFAGAGIAILADADNVTIESSFLGTNAAGTAAAPNQFGVLIVGSASNTIGGLTGTARNLISGNSAAGVAVRGATAVSNVIQGNSIGPALGGNTAIVGQGAGIVIEGDGTANSGARNNTIGGGIEAARNIISGNDGPGIRIQDAGANNNTIVRNTIGLTTSGTAPLANLIGVLLTSGSASSTVGGASVTARNLISTNATADVLIDGSSNNLVAGNLIGTNSDGTGLPGGPTTNTGVLIQNNSSGNTIGGSTTSAGNVISGHGVVGLSILGSLTPDPNDGVATQNLVQGNVIGAGVGGSGALPNAVGLLIGSAATDNTIGGLTTAARNIISGNTGDAIQIVDPETADNLVQGNLIGLAADGTTALANGGDGIQITASSSNTIGGTAIGAGNTIANNGGTGILVDSGTNNLLSRNLLFLNGALGIDLVNGGNNDQAAPSLTSAQTSGTTTTVAGTLNSTPATTFTVEFYSNDPPADPSGAGEGQRFIGQTTVTTDASGLGSFSANLTPAVAAGQFISAIAINNAAAPATQIGDTSQFATNVTNITVQADLAVTKTAVATPSAPAGQVATGAFLTYTITVTNQGIGTATAVTLADTLPANVTFIGGTATQGGPLSQTGNVINVPLGTIAPGGTATVTITVVSPQTIPSGNTITNTATASTTSGDSNSANNTASVVTTVVQGIDLSVSKVASPTQPILGSDFSYTITVTNKSSVAATGVNLTDTLPAGVTFVSATPSQGTVTESGGVVTASLGTLPPTSVTNPQGSSAQIIIKVRPTALGSIINTATATADQLQNVANDNTASLTTTVVDTTPIPGGAAPTVIRAARQGVHAESTRILVSYSEAMDVASVQRLNNYVLTTAGADGVLGTRDDRRIRFRAALYDRPTQTVVLTTTHPVSLHKSLRLRVVGQPPRGVRDSDGVFLAGTNGETGTDFTTTLQGRTPVTPGQTAASFRRRALAAAGR